MAGSSWEIDAVITCAACGTFTLPTRHCPHFGATGHGPSKAVVWLSLAAGCVGATTGEKDTTHSGDTDTTTPMPAYGISTSTTDMTYQDGPDMSYGTHSGGGSGAGGSGN